jgi:hypothetical protein
MNAMRLYLDDDGRFRINRFMSESPVPTSQNLSCTPKRKTLPWMTSVGRPSADPNVWI